MKKIKAFGFSLLLFIVFVSIFHAYSDKIRLKGGADFKRWYNQYKDKSYNALSENIDKETMLVFGSSEFGHHKNDWYHINNMFTDKDLNVLIIGQPYTQSINHAISLAALSQDIKNKKVVLVLSPTWFKGKGVNSNSFNFRFSDSQYIEMLKNPNISQELKEEIADRTLILLKGSDKTLKRVKLYNKVYLDNNTSITTNILETITEVSKVDQEVGAVKLAMLMKDKKTGNGKKTIEDKENIDWKALQQKAYEESKGQSNNPLHITDRLWKRRFEKRMAPMKDSYIDDDLVHSKEYHDLKLFLEVAKQEKIDVELIIQPINGYWYDHTGLDKDKRQACYNRIHKISGRYGAKLVDFSGYSYEPYTLSDAVHPWKRGWVLIDEAIFNFYKDGNSVQR